MYKFVITCLIVIISLYVFASTDTAGINFQDTYQTESSELILNGAGLRKKFVIKVYAAGLYLQQKQSDVSEILSSDAPAVIRMVMIYDKISSEKMKETWREGFEANVADISVLEDRINMLSSWFTEDAKTGDIIDIVYEPGKGSSLIINGERKGTIKGLDFKQALFSVWLGEHPADKKLKKALLGI